MNKHFLQKQFKLKKANLLNPKFQMFQQAKFRLLNNNLMNLIQALNHKINNKKILHSNNQIKTVINNHITKTLENKCQLFLTLMKNAIKMLNFKRF